jgi:hypothetical protein
LVHFFGEPGSMNDINILNKSSIDAKLLTNAFDLKIPPYTINGTTHNWMYFLTDGIYPTWSIFVKTIGQPVSDEQSKFASRQEYVRKDVERSFGVLVKQFKYLKHDIESPDVNLVKNALYTCIIFHNMIVNEQKIDFTFNDLEEIQQEQEDLGGVPSVSLYNSIGEILGLHSSEDE